MMIRMPRGDLRLERFLVNDLDGEITNVDFTEIYFTVKKTSKINSYLFQKKLSSGGIVKLGRGDYQLRIEPEDTDNLSYGNYRFDIQLVFIDSSNQIQIKETFSGDLILTDEVTFRSNE